MDKKCVTCDARCCRYYCVPLGVPAGDEDLDTARWYLLHEATTVFIDREGLWWARVENRCMMLVDGPKGPRCRDYRGRPLVCRRFSPETCDFTLGSWDYAHLFRTAKDLDEYVRKIPRVGRPKKRS
jgi:Fe-S-cluster containining protein